MSGTTKSTPTRLSVVFLPWLELESATTCTGTTFLPLEAALSMAAGKPAVIDQINSILKEYVLFPLKDRHDPTVATRSEWPFDPSNADQMTEIVESSKALAVCSISSNDYLFANRYTNSSVFEVIGQRFRLGDHHTAFVTRRRDGSGADMGYPYTALRTSAPAWVRQATHLGVNTELLAAVDRLSNAKPQDYRRLLLAFEWFLISFSDDPSRTLAMEAVALSAAFDQSHQSNITPPMLRKLFPELEHEDPAYNDANQLQTWLNAFRGRRDKVVHGSMSHRPLHEDLFLDLFVGTEVLLAVWKRQLANATLYSESPNDLERLGRSINVIRANDMEAWKRSIDITTRAAVRDPKIREMLREKFPASPET